MRAVESPHHRLGVTPISQISFDPKDRDDIARVLHGLQHLYNDEPCRTEIFTLLEDAFSKQADLKVGRPGMELWSVLVLAVLKEGINCDFDRLANLANEHKSLRQMLGLGSMDEGVRFHHRTLGGNVSRLTPELLADISEVVVRAGHRALKVQPDAPLQGRCDSFVCKTDVHYPTDVSLLDDAMRNLVRAAARLGGDGWRQHHYWQRQLKNSFNRVRSAKRRQRRTPEVVEEHLALCEQLLDKVRHTAKQPSFGSEVSVMLALLAIDYYLPHAVRQIDQVRRRLLHGEKIPTDEKVYSVFEPHTRWISKGKAGVPVELGVPLAIVEDQHQFILSHMILWNEHDVDVAVPIVEQVQQRYPEFAGCSFDRGFHNPSNRERLDELLELNALPKKGYLSQVEREREQGEQFVKARRQHPAVESAINNLQQRGLGRVRTHGAKGFARTVAISLLATNIHRLGSILWKQDKEKPANAKRRRRRRKAA